MMWKVMCTVTAEDVDAFHCNNKLEADNIDDVVERSLAQIKDPWAHDPVITGVYIYIAQL